MGYMATIVGDVDIELDVEAYENGLKYLMKLDSRIVQMFDLQAFIWEIREVVAAIQITRKNHEGEADDPDHSEPG